MALMYLLGGTQQKYAERAATYVFNMPYMQQQCDTGGRMRDRTCVA